MFVMVLISLHANFHDNRTKLTVTSNIKICRWGGGGKRAADCYDFFACPHQRITSKILFTLSDCCKRFGLLTKQAKTNIFGLHI